MDRLRERPLQSTAVIAATIALATGVLYVIVGSVISTLLALCLAIVVVGLTIHALARAEPKSKRAAVRYLTDIHRPTENGLRLTLLTVLAGVGVTFMIGLSKTLFAPDTAPQRHATVDSAPPELTTVLGILIVVAVLGPTAEEIVFRAMGQRFATYYIHPAGAIGLVSVCFALMHIPSYGGFTALSYITLFPLAVTFADSVLWGTLYYYTENTLYPIVAHGMANFIAVMVWAF